MARKVEPTPPPEPIDPWDSLRLERTRFRVRNEYAEPSDARWLLRVVDRALAVARELETIEPDSLAVAALRETLEITVVVTPQQAAIASQLAEVRKRPRQFGPTGQPLQDGDFVVLSSALRALAEELADPRGV
jgi:hypothetical protein